jgi:hypothetical protein
MFVLLWFPSGDRERALGNRARTDSRLRLSTIFFVVDAYDGLTTGVVAAIGGDFTGSTGHVGSSKLISPQARGGVSSL